MFKRAVFKFKPFSRRQKMIMTWWMPNSPAKDKRGIIADGAIRSGKTVPMSLSFVIWAMSTYNGQNFGMCGKTIGSFRRNVLSNLKLMLRARGYKVKDRRADNLVEVSKGGIVNDFYIFGGKDESSQDLIQGITLAGVLFDEVALMPESFVNQATGRCSVDGSKFWFNCNPEGPYHWFKQEWINKHDAVYIDESGQQQRGKNLLYLHFTMDDNLSLSQEIRAGYESLYSGVFYERYIRGMWSVAEGVIYPMFDKTRHIVKADDYFYVEYNVAVDYGTQNPTAFGLWGRTADNKHVMIKEYYHDGRAKGNRPDIQLAADFKEFVRGYKIKYVVVDPSAASFITQLRNDGYKVIKGKNNVLDGIRLVSSLLVQDKLLFDGGCDNTLKEFASYVWDSKAADRGEDKPLERFDHSMDQMRYYCNTLVGNRKARKNMSRGGVANR